MDCYWLRLFVESWQREFGWCTTPFDSRSCDASQVQTTSGSTRIAIKSFCRSLVTPSRSTTWASRHVAGGRPRDGVAILLLAANGIDAADARAENPAGEKFFENRIRPVLAGVCVRCHGPQKQSGGLRLDSREAIEKGGGSGAAIDATHFDESLLLEAVRREEGVSAMPPDQPLSKQQVADLTAWVSAGAPWPKQIPRIQAATHWAFQAVRSVAPPAVHDDRWVQTSVDPFILARLEGLGRKPAKAADRRTLLRRVTFDLTGLPPTHDEILAFERDPSPGALEDVVNRLLASPRYGEQWGRHWLDVVRYADTAGETADIPVPLAWRYRNYVIDAFNADQPYTEFVREQIAGDILAERRTARALRRTRDRDRISGDFAAIRLRFRELSPPDHPGHDRHPGPDRARPEPGLRPLPRSQVRPSVNERLLRALRDLRQQPLCVSRLGAKATDSDPGAACAAL